MLHTLSNCTSSEKVKMNKSNSKWKKNGIRAKNKMERVMGLHGAVTVVTVMWPKIACYKMLTVSLMEDDHLTVGLLPPAGSANQPTT